MPSHADRVQIHATAVAHQGQAVLLRGPSGAGKSDLALRLIAHDGWTLIADDQCDLTHRDGAVFVTCPNTLIGKIEARGIGILDTSNATEARVTLICDLTTAPIERLPEPEFEIILGQAIRRITLNPFEASTTAKLTVLMQNLML